MLVFLKKEHAIFDNIGFIFVEDELTCYVLLEMHEIILKFFVPLLVELLHADFRLQFRGEFLDLVPPIEEPHEVGSEDRNTASFPLGTVGNVADCCLDQHKYHRQ
jgi:hypothetical protein